jgi:hypothetical protein
MPIVGARPHARSARSARRSHSGWGGVLARKAGLRMAEVGGAATQVAATDRLRRTWSLAG